MLSRLRQVDRTALGFGLKSRNVLRIGGFTIAGSVVFFIISNFGHFAHGWNGYTLSGLAKTYIDAIPFFRNSLAGDVMGSALLFGAYHLLEQAFASKAITSKA